MFRNLGVDILDVTTDLGESQTGAGSAEKRRVALSRHSCVSLWKCCFVGDCYTDVSDTVT